MQGKIVLITGGAKRVGAAICRRLHAAGANLMLHFRASAGEARLLQAELNHVRANSVALIQADLLDLGKLPSLVEQTAADIRPARRLVNNASSFYPTPSATSASSDWNDLIGTNLQAPLFLSQAAAPALAKRKARSSTSPTSTPSVRSRTSSSTRSRRRDWSDSRARLRASLRPMSASTRSRPVRSSGPTTSRSTSFHGSGSFRIRRCGARVRRTTLQGRPLPARRSALRHRRNINVDGGRHIAL